MVSISNVREAPWRERPFAKLYVPARSFGQNGAEAMTKPIDIAELRRLLASAAPGPWCIHPNGTSAWQGTEYDSSGTLPDHEMTLRAPSASTDKAMRRAIDNLDAVVALRNAAETIFDELERLRAVALGFIDTAECAEANAANDGKGMQVPYHDDFAMLKQVPSMRRDLDQRARAFKRVFEEKS